MHSRLSAIYPMVGVVLLLSLAPAHAGSGSPALVGPRYLAQGAEVYDRKANLTWQRCNVGQSWNVQEGCVGMIQQLSFDDAQHLVDGKWRLPTKDELLGLIGQADKTPGQPADADDVAPADMALEKMWYWTGTAYGDAFAWYVSFSGPGFNQRGNTYAVRLVRSGR